MLVELAQTRAVRPHPGILEHHGAAQVFHLNGLANKPHVSLFQRLTGQHAAQAAAHKRQKTAVLIGQLLAQGHAQPLGKQHIPHQPGHQNAQHHFTDPHHRRIKQPQRMLHHRQHHDGHGVARQHKTVGHEVAIQGRPGGAQTNPQGHTHQQQLTLLREQAHQRDSHATAHQCAHGPVETFRQHHATGRVHHQRHRHHGGGRLLQVHAHGQPATDKNGQQRLAHVEPVQCGFA